MQISIILVQNETKVGKTGKPYQVLEITFKNLTFGKTESRMIFPFGETAETFKTLSTAQQGEVYDITVVKNDKGYNDWVKAVPGVEGADTSAPSQGGGTTVTTAKGTPAPRSNYETPEERAAKQVYIVRQSAIGYAIGTLAPGAKAALNSSDVLKLAQEYEAFVFSSPQNEAKAAVVKDVKDLEDDVL